jgi:hypothetical protein
MKTIITYHSIFIEVHPYKKGDLNVYRNIPEYYSRSKAESEKPEIKKQPTNRQERKHLRVVGLKV